MKRLTWLAAGLLCITIPFSEAVAWNGEAPSGEICDKNPLFMGCISPKVQYLSEKEEREAREARKVVDPAAIRRSQIKRLVKAFDKVPALEYWAVLDRCDGLGARTDIDDLVLTCWDSTKRSDGTLFSSPATIGRMPYSILKQSGFERVHFNEKTEIVDKQAVHFLDGVDVAPEEKLKLIVIDDETLKKALIQKAKAVKAENDREETIEDLKEIRKQLLK